MLRLPPPNPRAPILFEACAGLGNRIRAFASAMAAASDLSRNLIFTWSAKPNEFFGRFQDIFATEFLPPWVIENPGLTIQFTKDIQKEVLSQADWDALVAARQPTQEIVIKSHGQFYSRNQAKFLQMLRSLRPNVNLYKLLFGAIGPVNLKDFVGVHIRRTDNQKSIQSSPTPAFVVAMQAYPPTQKFYVATDDAFEREFLVHTFGPERIKFAAENLERNSHFGAMDSNVDFLALSMCREILGSVGSSFSEMAAAYGTIPLRLVAAPA
jgi:hypothetical protein